MFLLSFQGLAQELIQFSRNIDTPSIHVQNETLLTRYSVDAVLYELMNLVKNLCPDLNSRIYRAVPRYVKNSHRQILISDWLSVYIFYARILNDE